jgi:hypothetical protein
VTLRPNERAKERKIVMTHGAFRLSVIALGAAVAALVTPAGPATAEIRPHGSHGFAGPAVHGHGFNRGGPAFQHGFVRVGAYHTAMRVAHRGGHRYAVGGGRGYPHVRRYGYAYSHRYAYGRHGYAYRRYGGGYYAGGYSYPYYTGGSYYYRHHHHYPYYASGYSYRHHHGCWWYRHYDPYDMPSWCYGPAYGYSAPVYEYSYEPSYGYVYGVYGGTWRGGHHGHVWDGGGHHGHGAPTAPLIGAAHINGSPRGFAIAHGEAHFGGHVHGRFMH